jgi:hypothetical protein
MRADGASAKEERSLFFCSEENGKNRDGSIGWGYSTRFEQFVWPPQPKFDWFSMRLSPLDLGRKRSLV